MRTYMSILFVLKYYTEMSYKCYVIFYLTFEQACDIGGGNGVQGWSLVRSNPGEWLVTSYFLLHYLLYQLL